MVRILVAIALCGSALLVNDDPVRKRLDDSKAAYEKAMIEHGKKAEAWFNSQNKEARKRKSGVAERVKRLRTEKLVFDEQGVLPDRAPNSLRERPIKATATLTKAYMAAIDSYLRSENDTLAANVEEELAEILKRNRIQSAELGWTWIFNGADLQGFIPDQGPKSWFVFDGVLGTQANGSLFTQKSYSDFILKFDFQLTEDTGASIDLWSFPGETPVWVFLDNTRGAMAAITHSDGPGKGFAVRRLNPPAELKPSGQWNAMTIEVNDANIEVSLNGKVLDKSNYKWHMNKVRAKLPPEQRQLGRIGLNKRWGRGTIMLRNLSVKEL